jgi:hypothetical protein
MTNKEFNEVLTIMIGNRRERFLLFCEMLWEVITFPFRRKK